MANPVVSKVFSVGRVTPLQWAELDHFITAQSDRMISFLLVRVFM